MSFATMQEVVMEEDPREDTSAQPTKHGRAAEPDDWEYAEQEAQDWIDAEQEVQRMLCIDAEDCLG